MKIKLNKALLILLILTLTIAIISACAGGTDTTFKGVTSTEFARMMGYGINLGNTMEACDSSNRIPNRDTEVYETMWGNPVTTQEMITGMKDSGFKTLRVPVAWTNAMDFESGDFTINDAYLDRVEEIINYALNEDMYVIVNNHWDHGWWSMFGHPSEAWREFALEMFISMWTQIANRYEHFDHRVIFEPSNEEWGKRFNDRTPFSPTGGTLTEDECYKLLTKLSQVFVDLVRETGGNNKERFLLMKGYDTDVVMTVDERFIMPTDSVDNRLLLSVHYYTPWSYCGDTSGVGSWGRTTEVEEMNELLGSLTKFTDMGYGVVLGEWGVLDNEGPDRLRFFTNFLDNCDLHGFVPILWDTGYDEIYGRLFDRNNTLRIVAPDILELFQSRSVYAREGKTVEEIKAAAVDSMAITMEMAAQRVETVLTADEAVAWLMFVDGAWELQYSVGDVYRPEQIGNGMVATDVEITGEGTYTVAIDFTGTNAGFADGFEFTAVGIMNGEILFPGYYIDITEILVNGEPATDFAGIPYTTNDNPVTTRVNLFNHWVNNVPPEARVLGGDLSNASPTFFENYKLTHIKTISVTFDFVAP